MHPLTDSTIAFAHARVVVGTEDVDARYSIHYAVPIVHAHLVIADHLQWSKNMKEIANDWQFYFDCTSFLTCLTSLFVMYIVSVFLL